MISNISIYSCILPILAFLFIKLNWKEKSRWVCFFILVASISFDLLAIYIGKQSAAVGTIINASSEDSKVSSLIKIEKGSIHVGDMLIAGQHLGSVSKIYDHTNTPVNRVSSKTAVVVEGLNGIPMDGQTFKVISNLWVINIYILVESLLIFCFFFAIFKHQKTKRNIALGLMVLISASWIFRNIISQRLYLFDTLNNGIETIAIIALTILFFYDQITKPQTHFIYSTAEFWLVNGILIYKGGTFFFFLYYNILEKESNSSLANLYIINSVFLILRNILFFIAFLIKTPNSKESRLFKAAFAGNQSKAHESITS